MDYAVSIALLYYITGESMSIALKIPMVILCTALMIAFPVGAFFFVKRKFDHKKLNNWEE